MSLLLHIKLQSPFLLARTIKEKFRLYLSAEMDNDMLHVALETWQLMGLDCVWVCKAKQPVLLLCPKLKSQWP